MAEGARTRSLTFKLSIAAAVALFALTVAFVVMWSQRERGIPEALAHVYCEETVLRVMQIPDGARFSGIGATQDEPFTWQISGRVRGEDAAGEDVDSAYYCDVHGDAEGTMTSITIDIDGERYFDYP
ncbi:hypothetical protein ONR57_01430 [Hoyosella sp. YIM 151337]|uniref:hypothetical protein n=1 Tax=Hoyosella sp. YIM 151337 TaxID=2992742 RepID=UPI002236A2A8|nr:hypothetical protein [Hoyosella sp. YIM 151337]MCW4351961.1 hypothetical protein [Hoyosella sp. YIM 151337]